jgi:hypothetical protein
MTTFCIAFCESYLSTGGGGEVVTDERGMVPNTERGGGNARSACSKKEGKGLEAVASIESRGCVPRDVR